MPLHPLAEVFGYPFDNLSAEASRFRKNRLCPFGNKVPNCTKDKANSPLGICSIWNGEDTVITCPIRFRENWIIAEDSADFFFPDKQQWTTLTEVRLVDKNRKSAGNIDVVLVSYDNQGRVIDFGALEVQAVYISGNIRNPFEYYMQDPAKNTNMDWTKRPNYPRPDYLSSSRKRLAPQLIYKGGILKTWGKKVAVALNKGFYNTLPRLKPVSKADADVAWLVYDLKTDKKTMRYNLVRDETIYTKFKDALLTITRSEAGAVDDFIDLLQDKVDRKLNNNTPPDTETIDAQF